MFPQVEQQVLVCAILKPARRTWWLHLKTFRCVTRYAMDHIHAPKPTNSTFTFPDGATLESPPRPTSAVRRSSPLARTNSVTPSNGRRRVHSVNPAPAFPSTHPSRRRPIATSFGSSSVPRESTIEDSGISLFSDEYDLSHQDAKILQDVQRALKLKARREARLKSGPNAEATAPSASKTSPVKNAFPAPLSPGEPSQPRRPGLKIANHPVPSSSDEGTTLDWSGIGSDDDKERRWTMSMSRRKEKDKQPSDSAVETRESMHTAKLAQIRSKMSPKTLEQAAVARTQLGRRYNLVFNAQSAGSLNPVRVVRWFSEQDDLVRSSLEQAEPLTWLRNFDKSRKQKPRSPWHISALIAEEYLQHLRGTSRIIPPLPTHVSSLNSSSPSLSVQSPSPQTFPSPPGSSYFVLGPPLGRRLSPDAPSSTLEPPIDLGRKSMDRDSRKSAESAYSSLLSLPQAVAPAANQPFRARIDSDRSSLSEHSDDGLRKKRPVPAPLSRDLLSNASVRSGLRSVDLRSTMLSPILDDGRPESGSGFFSSTEFIPPTTARVRISLPPKEEFRIHMEQKRQEEAEEEATAREYEMKQRLLEATIAQNTRIRQLLNHIASGVREYDHVQTSLANSLKLPYKNLPRELVEAFSHDPSAVTGATRKYQGWRAVDDIHHRVVRQREIFRDYLAGTASNSPILSESVLEDPIEALAKTLHTLEEERREIAWRATEVSDVLKKVQAVHTKVKAAYNDTLSHTSVIYPEISTIVALEESYKDQYQYFWEVAMDIITFLLDTITPFWRTYGKVIGDDIQDFLIIPLYRNEFTGEAKRYPISRFPRRSLRHWVFLLLVFVASVTVTMLQTQAGVSSVYNFWLLNIPYAYIRLALLGPFWISIVVQWWAVVVESAIVLTQLAVVTWWIGWSLNVVS
ncbi:hypothetical protein HMN09_00655100 [Mycena chlorophos]|uniref:Uncharacterized protein n=1 Tax=Mycena chlorophos TaxID=658473 RepID=A0A8H6WG37_MYCCL|nr:hypothetical protein HMN09_00655100 [Mycena chlorophos]